MTDANSPALTQLDRPGWIPWTAIGVLLTGVGLGLAALLLRSYEVAHLLAAVGAGSLLAGTAATGWWLVGSARFRVEEAQREAAQAAMAQGQAAAVATPGAMPLLTGQGGDHRLRVSGEQRRLRLLCGWGQLALLPIPVLAIALVAVVRPLPASTANAWGFALGVAAIIAAFPLLIAERRLHTTDVRRSREARPLARLLRLLLWTLVVGGGCAIARSYDLDALRPVQWVISGLIAVIAAELALRAAMAPFMPVARLADATGLGDSLITGLMLSRSAPGDRRGGFTAGFKERFGIDLSQSWALRFLRAAALPLAAVLLIIGWLLSGLTTIGTSQRGIYERLGTPITVLPPGLHAHLPWPFGRVVRTEFGIVHELALGTPRSGASAADEAPMPTIAPDADPPAAFDRVWTKSHPTDVMYLVPGSSVAGTGVGYQLLMSDVRVLWRIGLSDDAARNSAYQVADPTMLIRTEALRQLQAVFATTSYPALIGADRALLTQRLQQALQTELDRHRSGVEITEVVIDAIHPPQEAVPSYHGVQAAEIGAATEVSKARSEAARTHADAQRETAERLAKATATAAEATATARTDATRFRADLDAFAMAPEAMRLERWLARTGSALGKAQVTIIDHRLDVDGGTTIDLRRPPAATE